MELKDLNEGDFFTLLDENRIYRILSFEMEGVRCVLLGIPEKLEYFSYCTIVEKI